MKRVLALIGALLILRPAWAQSDLVTLMGLDNQTKTLVAADLAAMPHQSAHLNDHGKIISYSGVGLGDLMALVGAPHGDALRGRALATVVVVEASDGYRVSFGLADLDPAFRKAPIILADQAEGKPLDAHEGPYRLVVEGDERPARSAKNVVRVSVKTLN